MSKGKLFIVSGPSGSGKDTLIERCLELNKNAVLSVSATTRNIRKGEQEGVHYYFKSIDRFREMIDRGELLEWAQYCENYYGTPLEPINRNLDNGMNVILNIDVQGAQQVKDKLPGAVSVFIMPPSVKILEERLRRRATDSEEAVLRRLDTAKREMELAKTYDFTVVNDDLDTAAARLSEIICPSR